MTVPYSFANATVSIPLSQLDDNFNTPITLGNTAIQLGNTVTTLNNMTLANVTISSGNVTITNVSVTTANVTTANITNMSSGNVAITGGSINGTTLGATTASTANVTTLTTSSTVTLNGGTANGVAYLNGSKVLTTGSALVFNGTQLGVNASPSQAFDVTADAASIAAFRSVGSGGNDKRLLITSGGDNIRLDSANQSGGAASMAFSIGSTEQMRLTSTGLGIGTSSPATKLDVNGDITQRNGSGITIGKIENASGWYSLTGDSANVNGAQMSHSTALRFVTASTERMRIDSSGNLGLGVTPSAWRTSEYKAVQIGIGASFYGRVTAGDEDKAGFSANAFYDQTDNRWEYIATDSASRYDQLSGGHYWFTAPSGTAGNAISFTQAMTLDASGNLIVADTSPAYSFSGRGNITIGGTSGSILGFRINSVNKGYIYHDGTNLDVNNVANGYLSFATNNTERARITSAGLFGIGTSSPTRTLSVYSSSSEGIIAIQNSTTGAGVNDGFQVQTVGNDAYVWNYENSFIAFGTNNTERARITSGGDLLVGTSSGNSRITAAYSSTNTFGILSENAADNPGVDGAAVIGNLSSSTGTNNTTAVIFRGRSAGADRFYVYGNGNVQNTNNSYGAISDVKLKENITDATPKLENLNRLRVVNYNLKGDTLKQIGLIAQEVEQVFPGLVDESPDVDPDTKEPTGEVTKSVKYSVLVPMLLKAVQELTVMNDDLRARVAQLENLKGN